ncbi:Imm45 family immunity protein [Pseudomonas daroniae]|uniref:Imm45 family immunity protein n=1 Tax=Phytopseudomonas daroniae TaxID=2487519 RepID=UPI0010384629|nr:hypothetical protein DNK10_07635 [Pseudomonas daroniae]
MLYTTPAQGVMHHLVSIYSKASMNWRSLIKTNEESFGRGTVFRFPAKHPFESVVDFMIIEDHNPPSFCKLICASGYHAGQTELVLPAEARHLSGGVSTVWLQNNWSKWVYPDCALESIHYIDCYPSNHGGQA